MQEADSTIPRVPNDKPGYHPRPRPKKDAEHLLKALGITRVINIDDAYGASPWASQEEIVGAVQSKDIAPDRIIAIIAPNNTVTATDDIDDIADHLRSEWDNLTDQQRIDLTQLLPPSEDSSTENDFESLRALSDLLTEIDGVAFAPITPEAWQESIDGSLEDPSPLLLLVDRDLSGGEGADAKGETLLKSIRDKKLQHVYIGLLTHTVTDPGEEETIAQQIANDGQVTVIAKSRLHDGAFLESIRVLLFASEIKGFVDLAKESLDHANDAAKKALSWAPKYLLLAAFEAATIEGAYEPDYALRLATATIRKVLAEDLRGSSVIELLERTRRANAVNLYLQGTPKPPELIQAEWDEQFLKGELLASLALPIEIGDIFTLEDMFGEGKERHYVLLSQACDLSVRQRGVRSHNFTTVNLTEVRAISPEDSGTVNGSNRAEFGVLFPESGEFWHVYFKKQIVVPTLAIDACVISRDGHSHISPATTIPINLPPSWKRRSQKMQAEVRKTLCAYRKMRKSLPDGKFSSEIDLHITASLLKTATKHKEGLTAKIDPEHEEITFGIKRIARISDTKARGLLSLLLQHQARPAFDGPLFADPSAES